MRFGGPYENKYDHSSCEEYDYHSHIVYTNCNKIAKGIAARCECKEVKWKDPLIDERIFSKNQPIDLQQQGEFTVKKRPKYVLGILYDDKGIYLSKRIDPNKEMYNLWQTVSEKLN